MILLIEQMLKLGKVMEKDMESISPILGDMLLAEGKLPFTVGQNYLN